MKATDVAVIKFKGGQGQELCGVFAGTTETGLAVLAPCSGYGNLVDDLPAARRILEWTRITVERGLDPVKVYDPETIGLSFVQLQDVLAIFVEDQRAISDLVVRWSEDK